jgi:hypothetical protein
MLRRWLKSVSAAVPLLREEDDEGVGPPNRPKGRAIGLTAEESKEDVFGPQREAGPKALDPFFFSNWNKSFEFKIKGFEYFQINFQMKSGLEPN